MRNVEIKAKAASIKDIRSNILDLFQRTRLDLTPENHFEIKQRDIFFRVARGRLKLRVFEDHTAELIFYLRENLAESKLSNYWRTPIQDANSMEILLTELHGRLGEVSKSREVFLFENIRIHLDQVIGLGDFLEIEVVLQPQESEEEGHQKAAWLMRELEINPDDLQSVSYFDMICNRS
jgi:predicted adenylyl cyclase CyaB